MTQPIEVAKVREAVLAVLELFAGDVPELEACQVDIERIPGEEGEVILIIDGERFRVSVSAVTF